MTRPLQRTDYARVERERRFVLDRLPPGVDEGDFVRLRDRFVTGAELRIRRVESPGGDHLVTKLGQKRPDPDAPDDPRRRLLTTIYLAPGESPPLAALPGVDCCKRRYSLEHHGATWAVDVWEEPAHRAGLILAEVECETDAELDGIALPDWATREVTTDPAFSAFVLAGGRQPPIPANSPRTR